MKKTLLFTVVLLLLCAKVKAEDSVRYYFKTSSVIGLDGYGSHYLNANRWGVYADERQNIVQQLGFVLPYQYKKLELELGAELLLRNSSKNPYLYPNKDFSSYFQQAYLQLNYGQLKFLLGVKQEKSDDYGGDLSTGSLARSSNARPLPQIAAGFKDFVGVPFTQDYVQIKGWLSHAWLENDRYVSNAYLHEKNAYIRLGDPLPVSLEMGFQHFAQWGGTSSNPKLGKLPGSVKDFLKYVIMPNGVENAPDELSNETNALGNHLGTIDLAVNIKTKPFNFQFYIQKPFEDGNNVGVNKFFQKFWNNKDFRLGFHLKNKNEKSLLSGVLFEFVKTDYQGGPGVSDPPRTGEKDADGFPTYEEDPDGTKYNNGYAYGGRDNNYNNSIYQSGWTHHGQIMGTPLFSTKRQLSRFYEDGHEALYGSTILNTRIRAVHLGIEGNLHPRMAYRFMATYSENYGSYNGYIVSDPTRTSENPIKWKFNEDYFYADGKKQYYFLYETNYQFKNPHWSANAALGVDVGEMTNNAGIMLGVKWSGAFELLKK